MSATTDLRPAVCALALSLAAGSAGAAERRVAAVEFTPTPAPASHAERVSTLTTSKAVLHYDDGSTSEHPLSYERLFRNTDLVGRHEAARLYDVTGEPLVDPNGDPVVAETPDANSLLTVDGRHFLVTHYEYDWVLGNGAPASKAQGWHSRMPMSMTLTELAQDPRTGRLSATSQRPIDFAGVEGLWIPCFGSQTPWNTHLGSEEDYDLHVVTDDGRPDRKAVAGLKAMTEVYFRGQRQANPYHYGFIPEVTVDADGATRVVKHYSMGRATWEQALVLPDRRTAYFGDDGDNVGLFLYVADRAEDLSAGTLYAARWHQTSAERGGAAALSWLRLGHATDAEVRAHIDAGTTFRDIFDITTPERTPDWQAQGYRPVRAGQSTTEYLRLRPGMAQAAAFLETRRYAGYLGATTEFNKMEGVAVDPRDRVLYLAMSYVDKGMTADPTAPADHIQVPRLDAGATYAIRTAPGQVDGEGAPIASDWVGVAMQVPRPLLGEDIATDALGNTAHPDKVANPDNLFFSEKMRTLFIGEDSGTHVNNFVWAYQVDTGRLSRILSLPSGAEATGLQVVENLNGHAYVMSNSQHQGEWLKSLPAEVRAGLEQAAEQRYGRSPKGALNYYLEADVGYIAGIPGL